MPHFPLFSRCRLSGMRSLRALLSAVFLCGALLAVLPPATARAEET